MNDELQERRLEDIVLHTFRDMGLEIADIMAISDLYPRDKNTRSAIAQAWAGKASPHHDEHRCE